MESEISRQEEKPASGLACVGLGVGFIALLSSCLVLVLMLAG